MGFRSSRLPRLPAALGPDHQPAGRHRRYWLARASAAVVVAAAVASGSGAATARPYTAHTARSFNGSATARLHLIKAEGAQLLETGPVTGALAGSAKANLYTGPEFTGVVTIQTRAGSLTGRGRAHPTGVGRYASFRGLLTIITGTGRYRRAHGQASLYGTFDRRNDSVVLQTVGTLAY